MRPKLTYANVIATIALFIALGGGAYALTKLPKNSVKSKQIKNGQVRNADLAADAVDAGKLAPGSVGLDDLPAAARPQHFAYSRSIGTPAETVLDFDGYKITAQCEDGGGGRPRLVANMTFPEAGSLDQQIAIGTATGGVPQPAVTFVGRGPAPVAAPGFRLADANPAAGKSYTEVLLATYSAPAHSAEITTHGIGDDPAKTCSLTGTLTETG